MDSYSEQDLANALQLLDAEWDKCAGALITESQLKRIKAIGDTNDAGERTRRITAIQADLVEQEKEGREKLARLMKDLGIDPSRDGTGSTSQDDANDTIAAATARFVQSVERETRQVAEQLMRSSTGVSRLPRARRMVI